LRKERQRYYLLSVEGLDKEGKGGEGGLKRDNRVPPLTPPPPKGERKRKKGRRRGRRRKEIDAFSSLSHLEGRKEEEKEKDDQRRREGNACHSYHL